MGNRAVISFQGSDVGIYLHWNGGRASVEGFLLAARELGVRANDPDYAIARLAQIIGNWMGGNLSVGVGSLKRLDCDNGDNGLYEIDPNSFTIAGRKHLYKGYSEEINDEKSAAIHREAVERSKAAFAGWKEAA